MIEILRLTGLKTPTEYLRETTPYDRAFLREGIRQWHKQHNGGGGGGGGGPPGPGGGLP